MRYAVRNWSDDVLGFIDELRRRSVLRVAVAYLAGSWLVVQVLATTLPVFGVEGGVTRWVIIALSIVFLPVLALSWAFEWTSAGLETQADVDRRGAGPPASRRAFDRIVIAVLSLAVLYFAADKFLFPALGGKNDVSIAVMPFADRTTDGASDYLGDGLAEDVLNALARNNILKVVARSSSFRFRESDAPIGEIAQLLGVTHILEGSIRDVGGRYRITVQLISARDGYNVWSSDFDRDVDHLYSTVADIREGVESALDVMATSKATVAAPPDPEAYVLALQAGYLVDGGGSDEDFAEAVELYRQAVAIDPDYAEAWANLSVAYSRQIDSAALDLDEGYERALDAALRAIRTGPNLSGGYSQLASIQAFYEGKLDAATASMQRALDIDSSSTATLGNAANLLLRIGRAEDAVKLEELLADRSPFDATGFWNLALGYRYVDRLADSEQQFLRVRELTPDHFSLNYHLGETVLLMGRHEEALGLFEAEDDEAYRLKGQALANHALGRAEPSDRALAELVEKHGEQWPSEVAHVHAYRGELDEAFEWLDREFDTYGPGGWGEWQLQRLYDNLRDDPRWRAFLVRTGTAPEQLASYRLELPPELLR